VIAIRTDLFGKDIGARTIQIVAVDQCHTLGDGLSDNPVRIAGGRQISYAPRMAPASPPIRVNRAPVLDPVGNHGRRAARLSTRIGLDNGKICRRCMGAQEAEDDGKPSSARSALCNITRFGDNRVITARVAMKAVAASLPLKELHPMDFVFMDDSGLTGQALPAFVGRHSRACLPAPRRCSIPTAPAPFQAIAQVLHSIWSGRGGILHAAMPRRHRLTHGQTLIRSWS
jgi:hypothetical protein